MTQNIQQLREEFNNKNKIMNSDLTFVPLEKKGRGIISLMGYKRKIV